MDPRPLRGSRSPVLAGFLLAGVVAADASPPQSAGGQAPFGRVINHGESGQAPSASKAAALKDWPQRTVRLIYFRPEDRPFRAEVVDSMKTATVQIQAFFAQQMREHGHGDLTFQAPQPQALRRLSATARRGSRGRSWPTPGRRGARPVW